jgi:hypothetical protein
MGLEAFEASVITSVALGINKRPFKNVSGSISTKIPRIAMKTTQTSVGEVSLIYLLTA